jgi:hypothetical protein
VTEIFVDNVQRSGIGGYKRALVETYTVDGRRAARILPVDDVGLLDETRWRLPCWNALSEDQRRELIEHGGCVREAGDGHCDRTAVVLVECPLDEDSPGPRFYCYRCGAARLLELYKKHHKEEVMPVTPA